MSYTGQALNERGHKVIAFYMSKFGSVLSVFSFKEKRLKSSQQKFWGRYFQDKIRSLSSMSGVEKTLTADTRWPANEFWVGE
jgi:hypothetical protein